MAQYLPILYAVLALGGLGILFGIVLGLADKKFSVEADERVSAVRAAVAGANCGAGGRCNSRMPHKPATSRNRATNNSRGLRMAWAEEEGSCRIIAPARIRA